MKNARALRHQVEIQALLSGSPAYAPSGEPNSEWTTIAACYASIEAVPLRSREFFAGQSFVSEVEVIITIRYRAGITADMRVVFENAVYNILTVIDQSSLKRELNLKCARGVNLG